MSILRHPVSGAGELRLDAGLLAQILVHARAELPNEACGLLTGSTATGVARAFHPARNADASPHRYTLHPDDLVRLTFAMERAGDDLLAIVHSHPRTGAEPSPTDRRAAQLYPGTLQLIVGLAAHGSGAVVRAWHVGSEAVEELTVLVGQPPGSVSRTSPVARSTTTSRPGDPSSPPER